MIKTYNARNIDWIDLENPTEDEVAGLVKRYNLHPLVGEELKTATGQAKADLYDDYILMVLNLPIRVKKGKNHEIVNREIDFVVGKHFLITCRYDTIEQIEYFSRVFQANAILNKDEKIQHAGFLFYYVIKRIYKGMIDDLKNIEDTLSFAEKKVFNGNEREMVEVLSNLSRELIDIKQTVRLHHDVWEQMIAMGDKTLFGKEFAYYVKNVRDEFNIIHEHMTNSRELLNDLRETNDSLLDTKQNEIIKMLTLIALIFSPLTFIAALFTIPADYVPIIGGHFGWGAIVAIMVILVFVIWFLFKKKRWI